MSSLIAADKPASRSCVMQGGAVKARARIDWQKVQTAACRSRCHRPAIPAGSSDPEQALPALLGVDPDGEPSEDRVGHDN